MIVSFVSFAFLIAADVQVQEQNNCLVPRDIAQKMGERGFVQERTLVGIEHALVSSGKVLVEQDSITWTVSDPIEISTVISESGMTQSIEGGPAQNVGAMGNTNPMFSQSGLIELLKGDLTSADLHYNVSEQINSTSWVLSLVPKAEEMAKHVSSIAVSGCRDVDSIKVLQANGDVISVSFLGD